jgi:hypothetical protein
MVLNKWVDTCGRAHKILIALYGVMFVIIVKNKFFLMLIMSAGVLAVSGCEPGPGADLGPVGGGGAVVALPFAVGIMAAPIVIPPAPVPMDAPLAVEAVAEPAGLSDEAKLWIAIGKIVETTGDVFGFRSDLLVEQPLERLIEISNLDVNYMPSVVGHWSGTIVTVRALKLLTESGGDAERKGEAEEKSPAATAMVVGEPAKFASAIVFDAVFEEKWLLIGRIARIIHTQAPDSSIDLYALREQPRAALAAMLTLSPAILRKTLSSLIS